MKPNLLSRGTAALFLSTWLAGSLATHATDVEKNLEKTFAVTSGGKLVIDADRGSITIAAGADGQVAVKVVRQASGTSSAKAEEILASHEVTFQQNGNDVLVKARSTKANTGWFWKGSNLRVRYEVQVPRQFSPDVRTAGGSIDIAELAGAVRAQTAGGSIKIGQTEGTIWAHTAGGSIDIAGASGTIEAQTAGGSITVRESGANVKAETSGGSIHLGKLRGATYARTAGGNIQIEDAVGCLDASTSGGSIKAALAGSPEEDCRLETAGGNVELAVPAGISANLDARTSGGRVTTDLPVTVQGELKRSSLQGTLGGGGKLLKLRTSAGNIRIKAR